MLRWWKRKYGSLKQMLTDDDAVMDRHISLRVHFGGFPKLSTILGVPIIRIIVFMGLYWGPPILGKYHIGFRVYFQGRSICDMPTLDPPGSTS